MISLCLATRKRPEQFKKLCQSALSMADSPDQIEFVSYHDNDDRSKYEYFGNHKEVIGDRSIDIFNMANECQKVATGPVYMYTADDFYFETKGWDTLVEQAFEKYPDRLVLVCPDWSLYGRWCFGVVGFVHKNWVDTLGYLLPPFDGGQAADQWLNEIAVSVGRRIMLPIRIPHSNVKDFIHHKKNARCREQEWTRKFRSQEMREKRKQDAEVMRCKIGQ